MADCRFLFLIRALLVEQIIQSNRIITASTAAILNVPFSKLTCY